MPTSAPTRAIFSAYAPSPLNDASVPPFPGHEADDEDDTEASAAILDFELGPNQWAAIPPQPPPHDVPTRFIDGSIASRVVEQIIVDGRARPLILSSIAAVALEFDGMKLRRRSALKIEKVLSVYSDGIDPLHLSESRATLMSIGVRLHSSPSQTFQPDFDSLRRATRNLAMTVMREAERDVMRQRPSTPTLMDGLVENSLIGQAHDVPVVGLVKRQMRTYLPASLQQMTYGLLPGQRSPAFVLKTEHVDLVNVYVRLSSEPGTSPSYGIVRIEVPLAYVQRYHRDDMTAYLSGLAGYLYQLRCRDRAYSRAAISIEPIVQVELHLHSVRPPIDVLIPKIHKLIPKEGRP